MYRRYIVVGVVFFILIGAYFVFFDKKDNNDYKKYYNKLVERENFSSYLNDVNLNIEEVMQDNLKYTYIITLDNVTEKKENIKILVLDEKCEKGNLEYFPSFGIIDHKGYSFVKLGEEDEEKKLLKGVNLSIADKDKIDNFIIYFYSDGIEQFVKVAAN